ncbi:MAG: helix-turn-helix transcriptional regulator [Lachnospiraceae bacterium]|nr:helix-turn-helix transcriptional regulator [Lachnospiraceae bacterium]
MTFGQRIKQRRLELNLTVDELANKLKKNRATIYRYEKDDIKDMPTTVLEPLANALETTPAYLMGWNDPALHNISVKKTINSSHINTIKVSSKEESIINKYRAIDNDGKKVVDTVLDREYERATLPMLKAAHERTDIEVTDEMKQHDEDIMNDENF